MQSARIDGGAEIAATRFAELSDSERSAYRGRLTCPYLPCAAPSHFRKRSTDGRPPLFYSNEHLGDCVEKSRERHEGVPGEFDEERAIWNAADELELRYDDVAGTVTVPSDEQEGRGRRGRHRLPGDDDRSTHSASIGLRPMLRRLRDDAVSLDWDKPLTLGDGTRGTLASIVHRAAPDVPLGQRVIVWGQIETARGEWINSGLKGARMPAVRVPAERLGDLLQRAGVDGIWRLTGSWFAVEGVFRLTSEDSPYRTLDDIRMIAFLPCPHRRPLGRP